MIFGIRGRYLSTRSTQAQLQRSRDNVLGPVGRILQVLLVEDSPPLHMQRQHRLGRPACGRIGIGAVVIDAQRREKRQQVDEV